jgi:acetate kinase
MGLTPAEGIIMGTRCGNIDPAALLHLIDNEGMDSKSVNTLINKKSGLLGLSGISNDMRDIEKAVKEGDRRAVVAYKTFCYSVKKYIGSYNAVLGNVDALIFTGGIGLYNSFAREEICKGLGALGMFIDSEKSRRLNGRKEVVDISTSDSPVKILVIPTNEELMIARETVSVIDNK